MFCDLQGFPIWLAVTQTFFLFDIESRCWVAQVGFELTCFLSAEMTGICHYAWLWKETGFSFLLSFWVAVCLTKWLLHNSTVLVWRANGITHTLLEFSLVELFPFKGHLPVLPGLQQTRPLGVRWCHYRLYLLVSISSEITLLSAVSFLVFQAVASYILSRDFCLLCDCSQESKSNLC